MNRKVFETLRPGRLRRTITLYSGAA